MRDKKGLMQGFFYLYLIFLVWIILFKMKFYISDLPRMHSLNFVPFGASVVVNGSIVYSEIFYNFLVFLPMGFFLEFLLSKISFWKKFCFIFLFSFFLEYFQYVFWIGASDITDVLMNCSGGIFGILFTKLSYCMCKNDEKLTIFLHYFVAFSSIFCFIFLLFYLFC